MDADVALKDFTSTAYVIERPAEADVLADAATAILRKAGLRIRFGAAARACREAEDAVSKKLPEGMALIGRGGVSPYSPGAPVIVASPPVTTSSATLLETWNAVGLAMHGYDCAAAASFAVKAALSMGADSSEVEMHPLAREAAIGTEPRFEVRPWGSAPKGPSWLPPDRFSTKSIKTAQGVHPDLLSVVARASEISRVRFEVVPGTGGIRTDKMQARMKAAGKSAAKIGRHTIGHAIDLVPVDGKGRPDFSDLDGFDAVRDAMKQAAEELGIPIQWGGNWRKLVDRPHFELDRKLYPAEGEEPDPHAIEVAFR